MKTLINEFNNMKSQPLFEIEYNGEYYIYHIQATEQGLEAGGCSNIGFMPSGIAVEWDEDESLDYHLDGLYELCYEDAMEQYNKEHEDDFNMSTNEAWEYIIKYDIATHKELMLIAHINGYSIETLDSVVYARTGFNTVEQFYDDNK